MSFVKQQLEQVSSIARCDYTTTCQLLVRTFDETASHLDEYLHTNMDNQQLTIQLGKLAWVIHLVGAVIGGRVSFAATDDHDSMDRELVIRVLRLMDVTDRRLPSGKGYVTVELAFLSFFDQFRKIYAGDQVQKTSKVYKRLGEVLNLTDESAILGIFVSKIITNLKYWSNNEQILTGTLRLLGDLSIGFSSVRKLVKLGTIRFLLENDPSSHFPFLNVDSKISDLRCRTTFYTSLGRLLLVDLGEDEEKLTRFMVPMTTTFHSLQQLLQNASSNATMSSHAVRTLLGVTRDCRGLAYAFNTKSSYMMLFDIIYPAFTDILQKSIELWSHDPDVTTPVLKLFAELVLKRGQRLDFDVASPNGILLFKEASKLVCGYGNRILAMGEPPKDQVFSHRLKGMSLCFRLLKNALCAGLVNFGVFQLYNDPTLEDALNVFVKLAMSTDSSHFLDYPKLSSSYYSLLEVAMQDHMNFVSGLPPSVVYHLLKTLTDGLTGLDTVICTCCCNTLDHLVTYLFRIGSRAPALSNGDITSAVSLKRRHNEVDRQREQHFLQMMIDRPDILQTALSTVLHTIMFEDCRNQWSMSRPLLGLILLNEEHMPTLQKTLCEPGVEHGRLNLESVSNCFNQLMFCVDKNLHSKTRDRFTQNLSMFRREVNDMIKAASSGQNTGAGLDLTANSSNMMT
ncbi:exportin-7-like isoform X1 [Clavelina lepadiformis]|uniref:exportin-7-like isoform X1 n=1 Tax=Clavelina lepadiformis TaxID=159417 RepID=UPI0040427672